jgi:guanosine-3',5'-bis(diphosphate) 3'-pyrophosphohydrolase
MSFSALLQALEFAANKHKDHRRKDLDASPYINHPIAVATILAVEGDVSDETVLVAALLHDTVEDTETTFDELTSHFGPGVSRLVQEVSDDKTKAPGERKRLQIERAPMNSDLAKQIKIADKICNISDLINCPPVDWTIERRREYVEWSQRVVDGCRGVNPKLDRTFDARVASARAAF